MDFFGKYQSPFGYQNGDNGVDSYGVDHSGFSTQDELQYQTLRLSRENELANDMVRQGIAQCDYPQYGTGFWGNNLSNATNYDISKLSPTVQNALNLARNLTVQNQQAPQPQELQNNIFTQQQKRNMENSLLMSGMDTLYGMNRAVNGMTFGGLDWLGNKLGVDTKMNDYLNLKDENSRTLAERTGKLAEFGGGVLSGGTIGAATYEPANMMYQGYKIGRAYDKLSQNPFAGNGTDVIARMKNHNGEPVVLQRGEAIAGEDGNVIVHGKALGRETGTVRNFGLNKGIYRHGVNRSDVQMIPKIIKQEPVETNQFGQNVYMSQGKNGDFRVVTSLKDDKNFISTTYYPKR